MAQMKESFVLEALFKALSHPVRLAILDILRDREACVCHLEAVLDQRQAYISQQLAVLREVGLIEIHRDGLNNFYYIAQPELFGMLDSARKMLGIEVPSRTATEPLEHCPCPHCASLRRIISEDSLTMTRHP